MNVSTSQVKIYKIGDHDAVTSRGVGTSDTMLLDGGTKLRVIVDSLDKGHGEESERDGSISQVKPPTSQCSCSLAISATGRGRYITECSLGSLVEKATIDGDTESEGGTTIMKRAWEPADRIRVHV